MSYPLIKHLHVLLAILTFTGFIARGYWMATGSDRLQRRLSRIAPHVVDTVFLLSGIAMMVMLSMNPVHQPWLLAKFAGLVLYILLGTIAIRRGATRRIRLLAFTAALPVFAYVAGVGLTKSPASWLMYWR